MTYLRILRLVAAVLYRVMQRVDQDGRAWAELADWDGRIAFRQIDYVKRVQKASGWEPVEVVTSREEWLARRDPQLTAYDDFDEDPETVFRLFDEGEKKQTRRPDWVQDTSLSGEETMRRFEALGPERTVGGVPTGTWTGGVTITECRTWPATTATPED